MSAISLSTPSLDAFLAKKSVAILATIQPSGAPLAMPMWFVHDDRAIIMISEAGLQKVRNLRRDPRVCVVVEGELNGTIAGAIIQGQVRFLQTPEEQAPYLNALHTKYSTLADRWGGRELPADRVIFHIEAKRLSTWGL